MDEDASPTPVPGQLSGGSARLEGEPEPTPTTTPPIPPPRERPRYRPLRGMEQLVDDFLG